MTSSDVLRRLCAQYQLAIANLVSPESSEPAKSDPAQSPTLDDDLSSTWQPGQVLKLLKTRDRIQALIDQLAQQPDAQDIPTSFWLSLTDADTTVREQLAPKFATYKPLAGWRDSFKPPDRHWWWFPQPPSDPKDPYGWLWGGCTIALLTVSLALSQDIATRFLTGAPGAWSSIGAIAPVALALFASGGVLTQVGQQILAAILANKVPKQRYWPRLKFGLAALLLVGLFAMHQAGLPHFAKNFYQTGQVLYKEGQWATAQNHFERALSLTPDFPEAQFDLGVLYEDYQEYDQAQKQYLKAVQAKYLPAYNNLARLYLRKDNNDEAAQLLRLALADPTLAFVVQQEKDLEYVLRKNLGWVRLKQNRLAEAETELMEANKLNKTMNLSRPDAHCLLAQVLQKLDAPQPPADEQPQPSEGDGSQPIPDSALIQWKQCLQAANRPEYDAWEGMARNALTQPQDAPNAN